jgi:hypothetical protein
MNPPPSYHEILQLLNKTRLNEMKLTEELKDLKTQLKKTEIELKLCKNAYILSKQTEYKLEKFISKL